MARPIRGSQVPPLVPNNVQAECICVPKVYDFVVFTEDINTTVPVTPTAGCPTTVTDITCSLVTETFFPISCEANGVCTILERRDVTFDGINAALVKLRQEIPVNVTFSGTDATGAPATCTIPVTVPFIRQVVLCFPPEFTNDNLICRIIGGDCTVTSPPPVGGQPFPSSVGLELLVCKEIQVLASVKLEVLAKFCSPRQPIELPTPAICPPTLFPQQCDFFPQPNCDCQSTVDSQNAVVGVNVGLVLNGLTVSAGTASLVATICNACAEVNTSIRFTFTGAYYNLTDNFTFTANSFTSETCVETTTHIINGQGTVITAGGDTIPVTYMLTLIDGGALDSYILNLSGPGFTAIATSLLIGNAVTIQDCTTFPPPTT